MASPGLVWATEQDAPNKTKPSVKHLQVTRMDTFTNTWTGKVSRIASTCSADPAVVSTVGNVSPKDEAQPPLFLTQEVA